MLTDFPFEIDTFKISGPVGNWNLYSTSLADFAGQDIYVAVVHYLTNSGPPGNSGDHVWLDHFIHTGTPTGIAGSGAPQPRRFTLGQNYPNPFNPVTNVEFGMQDAEWVTLTIYDLLGREVKTLLDAHREPGNYTVEWNGTNDAGQPVVSGIYLYRLQAGSFIANRKMILLR